jgi:predicted ATPase
MIDYIKIAGYKSLREATIKLTPINILIGANGAGKSNFISFFEFLNALSEQKLKKYIALHGGEDKIFHNGSDTTSRIKLEISFNNSEYKYCAEIEMSSEGIIFNYETIHHLKNEEFKLNSYGVESKLKEDCTDSATKITGWLQDFKIYHFQNTGKNTPFFKMSHIENDKYFLYEDGNNLAAFLYHIKKNYSHNYYRIIKVIKSIAPFFSDFFLEPNSEGYIRLQWKDQYSSTIYGVNDLSDGTLRFIALCVLFYQPKPPSTIIIDEPELGLHPAAIKKLAGLINIAAQKNCQVIVSTQSADLINNFKPEHIITVDHKNGESSFARLNSKDLSTWLDQYTLGDLWQRQLIDSGQPK